MTLLFSQRLAPALVAIGIASTALLGCDDGNYTPASPAATLAQATHPDIGNYVETADGATLYVFTNDTKAVDAADPVSACAGGCLAAWPAYYDADSVVATGLAAADFASFKRPDGAWQSTYKGWPLYTHGADTASGDVNGHAKGGTWYAAGAIPAPRATFSKAYDETVGDHIITADGFSLYIKANDIKADEQHETASSCSGACLENYPLFHVALESVGESLSKDDFGWFTRSDGLKQSTYKGWPLYTYHGDDAGDLHGHADMWFAAGTPIPSLN